MIDLLEPFRSFARLRHVSVSDSKASLIPSDDVWRDVPAKVLFLDFDGVLHRKMTGTFEHLPAFESWLRSTKGVGVVISSSWRSCDRDHLERIFSNDLIHLIVGRTIKEGVLQSRQQEILKFVRDNQVSDFMVLDDDDDEFDPAWPNRISTQYSTGLTVQDVQLLTFRSSKGDQNQ